MNINGEAVLQKCETVPCMRALQTKIFPETQGSQQKGNISKVYSANEADRL